MDKDIKVVKRDGSLASFDEDKIYNAVNAAFESVGSSFQTRLFRAMMKELFTVCPNPVGVEEIQNRIERWLMDHKFFQAAKAFILYREKHSLARKSAKMDIDFIHRFVEANNAADATIDDNANVGSKSVGVLNSEIHKENNQWTNLRLWGEEVHKLYPEISLKQFLEDGETLFYYHDSSSKIIQPYCMAVSLYQFLLRGLQDMGEKARAPKKLSSFVGEYINLVFRLAGEVKGAVATPEVLMYMDYFCRKEWGEDYYKRESEVTTTEGVKEKKTIGSEIDQYFQQMAHSINQAAGNRGDQSPFTNFSFFDKYFFEGMFSDFVFPDGDKPVWESTNWLQKRFLHWLNQERLHSMLTFPVCSYACVIGEDNKFKDQETFRFICREYAEGNSFFLYISHSVDSLSSCCRLRNALSENTFNMTNGQIGVMTGSKQVITLNLNRIIQDWHRSIGKPDPFSLDYYKSSMKDYLAGKLERVYKYLTAYNHLLHWAKDHHLYRSYDAGFIDLDKQYLTIGINGLNQAAEYLGIQCTNNRLYRDFCRFIFQTIKEENTAHRTAHERFNTEQVPAESAAIKLYNRDKKDGYWVPEDTNLYASYIFKPNDSSVSVLDKIYMHSEAFASDCLDGGSACHINLSEHLSEKQYEKLLEYAAEVGCSYLTFNIPNSECDDCGFITKVPIAECPHCHSRHITLYDRIIGYLVAVKNWSKGRQDEFKTRVRC